MEDLFGGSKGSSDSQSGFSLLPPQLQQAFTQFASALNGQTGDLSKMFSAFTPPSLNAGSQSSLSDLENNKFALTPENVQKSMDMQTNPFDSSVIDTINKQAAGQGSVLNSNLASAGQFGSNRAALGSNDIDLSRLQQIGTFKNNEFQTAMNNALTTIPQGQTMGAENSVNAGLMGQQQQMGQQMAPWNAMQFWSSLLSGLPQSGGSTSTGSQQAQNGIFKSLTL